MADFCVQCATELGFETDLANITTEEDWANCRAAVVLCEGCGPIQVDPQGHCISAECHEKHGSKRLAAATSASALLQAPTEGAGEDAAALTAAETNFAFMKRDRESGTG